MSSGAAGSGRRATALGLSRFESLEARGERIDALDEPHLVAAI